VNSFKKDIFIEKREKQEKQEKQKKEVNTKIF